MVLAETARVAVVYDVGTKSKNEYLVSYKVDVNDGVGMFVPEHSIDVYWDPTGFRAAMVLWTLPAQTGEANCEVSRAEPKKDRNATVIYAAAGSEYDAQAIAKLIKGATVEPLTWKPGVEIVVALGAPGVR